MTQIPDALITRVQSAWPEVHADLVSLRAEMTAIAQKGFDGGRSLLNNDAANLVHSLEGICDFRETGLTTPDVEAAEAETRTLIQDMRKRALDTIRDRGAMLRIHAESASLRADPDIKPRDLTDGFRLLAAAPVEAEAVRTLSVQDTGLPAVGGPIGRVVGDVLVLTAGTHPDTVENAAPLGTFYLPPGNSVTLRKGEQVILRTQGISLSDVSLKDAVRDVADHQIEAVADGVRIYGPATLAAHEGFPVHEMLRMATEMRANTETPRWPKRILASVDRSFLLGCSGFIPLMIAMVGSIPFTMDTAQPAEVPSVLVYLLMGGIGISATGFLNAAAQHYGWLKGKMFRLPEITGDLPRFEQEGLRVERSRILRDLVKRPEHVRTGYDYQDFVGGIFLDRIRRASRLTFFAARRVVSADPDGVPVIKPLVALEAPKPDVDATAFTQTKTKA